MKITVVQPSYFMGDRPDENIASFLLHELEQAEPNSLIVLPEYANAAGISGKEAMENAIPRAGEMLAKASAVA